MRRRRIFRVYFDLQPVHCFACPLALELARHRGMATIKVDLVSNATLASGCSLAMDLDLVLLAVVIHRRYFLGTRLSRFFPAFLRLIYRLAFEYIV